MARKHAPALVHPHPPTHTRTHSRIGMPSPMRGRTHAHTQKYVILIAFPRQLLFRERTSMLRYTCVALFFIIQTRLVELNCDTPQ